MPSATAAPPRVDYSRVEGEILSRLDLRAVFASLGVQFTQQTPNPAGWLECRAIGREDAKPSAGCHLASGRYKDFARPDDNLSLWDFAAKYGGSAYGGDWKAARAELARQAGVEIPEEPEAAAFKALEILPESPNDDLLLETWCRTKRGTTPAAVRAAGGRIGRYRRRYTVVVVPVVGPSLDREQSTGWVAWEITGKDLPTFTRGNKEPTGWTKMKTLAGSKRGLIVLGNPSAHIAWKVEGPTDAMALWAAIPEAERPSHVVITNTDGASAHPDAWRVGAFSASRRVHVIGDADTPGQRGAEKWAAAIAASGKDVRNVALPYDSAATHGKDIRDFLDEHTFAELAGIAESTKPAVGKQERPRLVVDPEEERVVDDAIAALASDSNLYQRGGELVQIIVDNLPPARLQVAGAIPRAVPLSLPAIRERMSRSATWVRYGGPEKGYEHCHIPDWAVKQLAARNHWDAKYIPPLDSIVESPIIRPDGSILQSPGYDSATGIVYRPSAEFPEVPEFPTKEHAQQAAFDLLEIVCDFPFETFAHRSAWLAALLTPFARYVAPGPAPLVLIDANVPGAGKGLIADTISLVFSGRTAAVKGCPGDDAEWEKFITSIAIAGFPLVLIDNIAGGFGSPHLDAVLTGSEWSGRILGRSETKRFNLATTWLATGNNITLRGDLPRRVLPIRLLSPLESPESRSDLTHPNLPEWIKDHRPRFVTCALTILRAYLAAGSPSPPTPWGSFNAWSNLVRGAINWLGMVDPIESRDESATSSDNDRVILARLIDAWQALDPSSQGISAADAVYAIESKTPSAKPLADLLSEIFPKIDAKRLGMKLAQFRRRRSQNTFLDFFPHGKGKRAWFVAQCTPESPP